MISLPSRNRASSRAFAGSSTHRKCLLALCDNVCLRLSQRGSLLKMAALRSGALERDALAHRIPAPLLKPQKL